MKKTILSSALLLSVCCAANAAPSLITNAADAALAGSTIVDFNAEALEHLHVAELWRQENTNKKPNNNKFRITRYNKSNQIYYFNVGKRSIA